MFLKHTWAGLRAMLVFTVILGVAYPLTMWLFGSIVASDQASGSHLRVGEQVVGSRLIGQSFTGDQWLWGRPSANDYDAMASGGTNLGPNSSVLLAKVEERRKAIAAANGTSVADVPAEAVTASASGLDPHISPRYAEQQVARIARARQMDPADVRAAIASATSRRILEVLGEPVVNVVEANAALSRRR